MVCNLTQFIFVFDENACLIKTYFIFCKVLSDPSPLIALPCHHCGMAPMIFSHFQQPFNRPRISMGNWAAQRKQLQEAVSPRKRKF